jgi:hypothetical protein
VTTFPGILALAELVREQVLSVEVRISIDHRHPSPEPPGPTTRAINAQDHVSPGHGHRGHAVDLWSGTGSNCRPSAFQVNREVSLFGLRAGGMVRRDVLRAVAKAPY